MSTRRAGLQQRQLRSAQAPRQHAASRQRVPAVQASLDDLELEMPEIDGDLRSIQEELGAVFNDNGVVRTYGNANQAVSAVESGVVLVDRSHWGRIRVGGEDRLSFLHNQSTNDFKSMQPGQGCDTVFVTASARTLDIGTVLINQSNALVITSPEMKQHLLERFDKHIFPADKVQVKDVSEQCAMLTLIGPESDNVLKEIAGDAITIYGKPYGSHQLLKFKSGPVILVAGSGLAAPGYTLLADESVAGELFAVLASKGCVLMGQDEWDCARILAGRPAVGAELTEDFNPLEAGLCKAVSVDKGCYIGQETLAKLTNLNGVKQQLWGFELEGPIEAGSSLTDQDGARLGRITSVTTTPEGRNFALGYIRCKSSGKQVDVEGKDVKAGDVAARVVPIRYASRMVVTDDPSEEQKHQKAEDERKSAEVAKAERLQQMQERLAAYQQQVQAAKGQ
eukprot:CAMPEP_0202354094 /NCGR_PEP_ID=MMETSP1126-20121109/9569_1 /ASSEMBLY_ACC=CAM_ASM_000457 /TAXON_ID=3047 /ORGANISM="Dunaliella tertiolecta, Strain CCMP1320" /LENGTH=450 /DNA_ID=CAMNT_0048946527 /DNA_START=178 /DNA_END=1530 /DNA_ORIENTATION=-